MQISQILSVVALMVSVTVAICRRHLSTCGPQMSSHVTLEVVAKSDVFPQYSSVTPARTAVGPTGAPAEGNTRLATGCAMSQRILKLSGKRVYSAYSTELSRRT